MPRSAAVLPAGIRVTDFISLGTLARVFPRTKIHAALRKAGKEGSRQRDLPNHIVIYYVLMMVFYPNAAYQEVLRCVLDGLQWLFGPHVAKVTAKSAITQARQRVGPEPLRILYENTVAPIATKKTKGAHYREWAVQALDGTLTDLPDTEANRKFFGKSSNQNVSEAGYPKLRAVSLVECGTHVIHSTELGWFKKVTPDEDETTAVVRRELVGQADVAGDRHSERYLASLLLPRLNESMLVLADRGFFSFELWRNAAATGAALVWRIKDDVKIHVQKQLRDGSSLGSIVRGGEEVEVRQIEYQIKGSDEFFRLITTILDPGKASAKELAELYHERWEIETTYKELKKHLNLFRITLRSKTPELVYQEFWGLLLVHYAVRGVMHEAALKADEDPDRISFTHSVNVIRRHLSRFGHFPPSADSQCNH